MSANCFSSCGLQSLPAEIRLWTPLGDFRPRAPWATAPKMKNPNDVNAQMRATGHPWVTIIDSPVATAPVKQASDQPLNVTFLF